MNFIKEEIRNEAERCFTRMNKNNKEQVNNETNNNKTLQKSETNKADKVDDYIKQAEIYICKLDERRDLTFEEKMVFLYTLEGFIFYSINPVLSSGLTLNSMLFLYFIILQASISIVSEKYQKTNNA